MKKRDSADFLILVNQNTPKQKQHYRKKKSRLSMAAYKLLKEK